MKKQVTMPNMNGLANGGGAGNMLRKMMTKQTEAENSSRGEESEEDEVYVPLGEIFSLFALLLVLVAGIVHLSQI